MPACWQQGWLMRDLFFYFLKRKADSEINVVQPPAESTFNHLQALICLSWDKNAWLAALIGTFSEIATVKFLAHNYVPIYSHNNYDNVILIL